MAIDFGKIVTNALSTLVAAVFIVAGAIVWTAATTIDGTIEENKKLLEAHHADLIASQETILGQATSNSGELEWLRGSIVQIVQQLNDTSADPSLALPGESPRFDLGDSDAFQKWRGEEEMRLMNDIKDCSKRILNTRQSQDH